MSTDVNTPVADAVVLGPLDEINGHSASAHVRVELHLGADTNVMRTTGGEGMPEVSVWAGAYDVAFKVWENTTTGETELRATEELAEAVLWYAREVRALAERNHRQLAETGDGSRDAARSPGLRELICPVWCASERCTARTNGQHRSVAVDMESRLDELPLPDIWLEQTPGEIAVLVVAMPPDGNITGAPGTPARTTVRHYPLYQAERLWNRLGWLLDGPKVRA